MQRRGIGGGGQLFAKALVGEHLRQFGKQLQMLFVGGFRHQQDENQADRLAVGCVELNRRLEPDKSADAAS